MIRIPMQTHYWFIKEAHESWERDQRQIYCLILPHSTKPIPYLEQNWVVLWLCWPKTQLCKIVHCNNTSKISWLVHHKGAWVLGGESTTDFLPNLDVTWRGQPIICINIEYVCGYFDQKYNYVGSYIIRVPIKTHCCPLVSCGVPAGLLLRRSKNFRGCSLLLLPLLLRQDVSTLPICRCCFCSLILVLLLAPYWIIKLRVIYVLPCLRHA